MALSQKLAGYTGIWHIFKCIGIRVVSVVKYLMELFSLFEDTVLKLKIVRYKKICSRRKDCRLQNCEASSEARKKEHACFSSLLVQNCLFEN